MMIRRLIKNSAYRARNYWSTLLGQTHGGDRDIYIEAGWKKNPTFVDYKDKFDRQDIASTVVEAYPNATWKDKILIRENDEDIETAFEKEIDAHIEQFNLFSILRRADVMSGVGAYGVLLIGFNDGKELNEPAESASEVLFLQPYYENKAEISTWNNDKTSSRFGLPETYSITTRQGNNEDGEVLKVHWTRIIHVAENIYDSELYGTPRLQRVQNRLTDIEKICAASGEGYWKRGFSTRAFIKDADADWDDTEAQMDEQIDEMDNGLSRSLRLSGIKVADLTSAIDSPGPHFEMQMDLLSAASRIPKRILLGTEEGKLAGNQDGTNWNNRIDERREYFATPLLKLYIDRLILVGVFTEPSQYEIIWVTENKLTQTEQSEIMKNKAVAAKDYASQLPNGIDQVIPVYYFLVDFLGIDEKRALKYGEAALQEFIREAGDTIEE